MPTLPRTGPRLAPPVAPRKQPPAANAGYENPSFESQCPSTATVDLSRPEVKPPHRTRNSPACMAHPVSADGALAAGLPASPLQVHRDVLRLQVLLDALRAAL